MKRSLLQEIVSLFGLFFLLPTLAIVITYFVQNFLHLSSYLADVGSINSFVVVFGTLYGIMTAFIVVEVWNQYNTSVHLFEHEAQALEKLFRLSLYFRNDKLHTDFEHVISEYATIVIDNDFRHLGEGERHLDEEKIFRKISHVINEITIQSDHSQVVFDHIINQYSELSQVRTERINHSLIRLPFPLKAFFYIASLIIILTFILMPFANIFYDYLAVGALVFILTMASYIIEGLDNPFVGFWKLKPESFERMLTHIKEDY